MTGGLLRGAKGCLAHDNGCFFEWPSSERDARACVDPSVVGASDRGAIRRNRWVRKWFWSGCSSRASVLSLLEDAVSNVEESRLRHLDDKGVRVLFPRWLPQPKGAGGRRRSESSVAAESRG